MQWNYQIWTRHFHTRCEWKSFIIWITRLMPDDLLTSACAPICQMLRIVVSLRIFVVNIKLFHMWFQGFEKTVRTPHLRYVSLAIFHCESFALDISTQYVIFIRTLHFLNIFVLSTDLLVWVSVYTFESKKSLFIDSN